MTVNRRWRITFRFAEGDAHDIPIGEARLGVREILEGVDARPETG